MNLNKKDVELLEKSAEAIKDLEEKIEKMASEKDIEINDLKEKLASTQGELSEIKKNQKIASLLDKIEEKNLLPDESLRDELKKKIANEDDIDKLASFIDTLSGVEGEEGNLIGESNSGNNAAVDFLRDINKSYNLY